jgi:transcriptional regulator with XRE-family HTH domain
MPGINSYEKKGTSSDFLRQEAFVKKTQQEIAESLGTGRSAVVAMKNHSRGASVQVAKKAAATTGQSPANIYLTSQVAALQKRISTKAIKDENVLGACQSIIGAIKGQFRSDEFDRSDPEFIRAAENLKAIAEAALDMAPTDGNGEPVNSTGDSVAAALKGQRDLNGKAIPEGDKIERDAHGRRVR